MKWIILRSILTGNTKTNLKYLRLILIEYTRFSILSVPVSSRSFDQNKDMYCS